MEYEDITPPPFLSIKNKINQCDALFVILSEYLEKRLHTANWVAFEIGLAANHMVIPPFPAPPLPVPSGMDVYLFEPIDNPINFAVPYCTYYARYNPSDIGQIKFLKRIAGLAPNHNSGSVIKCPYPDCQLEFKLFRTYTFETSFSISVDVFCIVYSILTNIRYAGTDYLHSNA